jgi:hypothetical protein
MQTRWNIRLVAAAAVWAAASPALATERHVPGEYGTIQAAIDACVAGDTVIVADGTYTGVGNRDIDFAGKALTVRSANGPANCTVDCQGSAQSKHRGFCFHTFENATSVLDGFTIQNGYAPLEGSCGTSGGGIVCRDNANPTIRNCVLRWNVAPGY